MYGGVIVYIKYLYLLCLKFIDIFFICCLVKFKSFLYIGGKI